MIQYQKPSNLPQTSRSSSLKSVQEGNPKVLRQTFDCTKCSKKFISQQFLDLHVTSHVKIIKPKTAKISVKTVTKKTVIKQNSKKKTSDNTTENIAEDIKCKFCGITFTNRILLNNHEKDHLANKDFGCNICDENFESELALKQHLRSYGDYKKLECTKCCKKYDDVIKLTQHLDRHAKERFKCAICSRQFKTRHAVMGHQLVHGDDKDLKFECAECGKKFKRKSELARDLRKHLEVDIFQCGLCEKSCKSMESLGAHIRSHQKHQSKKSKKHI
jgi:KRAB domain-containing zinc finger protein